MIEFIWNNFFVFDSNRAPEIKYVCTNQSWILVNIWDWKVIVGVILFWSVVRLSPKVLFTSDFFDWTPVFITKSFTIKWVIDLIPSTPFKHFHMKWYLLTLDGNTLLHFCQQSLKFFKSTTLATYISVQVSLQWVLSFLLFHLLN